MKKSLDEFFNWNNDLYLFKAFKESIIKAFEGETEKENYIKIFSELLYLSKKNTNKNKRRF